MATPDFQPTDKFFDVDGLRLHYLDWGTPSPDAPTMVLLHGLQDCARSWDIFAATISSDYRVIALDQPRDMATARMPLQTLTASATTSQT